MSKIVEGLEREANISVCISYEGDEYEYVMAESIFEEMMNLQMVREDMIKWLDARKDVITVDLSVDIKLA